MTPHNASAGLAPYHDTFADLAPYYDAIMSHVAYDKWSTVTTLLAELLPTGPFTHLDVACGTAVLVKELHRDGWNTTGLDLSHPMLRTGRKGIVRPRLVAADIRALPFSAPFDYVTCLFDSLNFLLEPGHVQQAFRQVSEILSPTGLFYFDIVTERMVTQHFEGQTWTEDNDGFTTTWEGTYDRRTSVAETTIRVKSGPATVIRERVYPLGHIEDALAEAGLTLLGALDAQTWRPPRKKTVRIDLVATRDRSKQRRKAFRVMRDRIQALLI